MQFASNYDKNTAFGLANHYQNNKTVPYIATGLSLTPPWYKQNCLIKENMITTLNEHCIRFLQTKQLLAM